MVRGMKKIVAVSLAAGAATLVAVWRKVIRDNQSPEDEIAMEPGMPLDASPTVSAANPSAASAASSERSSAPSATATPGKVKDPAGADPATAESSASAATASEESSRAELYEIAQGLKIEGRSKMSKAELLKAIRAAG